MLKMSQAMRNRNIVKSQKITNVKYQIDKLTNQLTETGTNKQIDLNLQYLCRVLICSEK